MHTNDNEPATSGRKRQASEPSQLGLDFSLVLAERAVTAQAAVELQAPPAEGAKGGDANDQQRAADSDGPSSPDMRTLPVGTAGGDLQIWPLDVIPWSAQPSGDPHTVLLVDAQSILEQCAHIPKLAQIVGPNGQPAGIVRGFARALLRLLGQHKPQLVAVVFEHPDGNKRRRELISEAYKQDPPSLEVIMQADVSRTLAELLGCTTIASAQGESVDVIGTIASRCPADYPVIVASQRTQLLQLGQREDLAVTYWQAGEQLTEHASVDCRRRLRIEVREVVAYQGLLAVRGIGEASAREILRAVDPKGAGIEARLLDLVSLDSFGIAAGLPPKMRGRMRVAQALLDGREQLRRAMLAARIVRDVDDLGEVPTAAEVTERLCRRERDDDYLKVLGDAWGIKELRGDYEDTDGGRQNFVES